MFKHRIVVSVVFVLMVALLVLLLSGCLLRLARSPYCGHSQQLIDGRLHIFQGERSNRAGSNNDHNVLIVYPTNVGDGDVDIPAIAINCHGKD